MKENENKREPLEMVKDIQAMHEEVKEKVAETHKDAIQEGVDTEYDETVKNLDTPIKTGLMAAMKPIKCPLCLKDMHLIKDPIRNVFAWACDLDRVAVNILDPLAGKWMLKATEKIECINPNCSGEAMRMFFTSTGFMKAKCPKCGATISNANRDRKTAGPALKRDGWAKS